MKAAPPPCPHAVICERCPGRACTPEERVRVERNWMLAKLRNR